MKQVPPVDDLSALRVSNNLDLSLYSGEICCFSTSHLYNRLQEPNFTLITTLSLAVAFQLEVRDLNSKFDEQDLRRNWSGEEQILESDSTKEEVLIWMKMIWYSMKREA